MNVLLTWTSLTYVPARGVSTRQKPAIKIRTAFVARMVALCTLFVNRHSLTLLSKFCQTVFNIIKKNDSNFGAATVSKIWKSSKKNDSNFGAASHTLKKKNCKYCGTFVREGKSEHTVCYDCVPTQPQPHRKLSNEFSDKTWWWFLFELYDNL